MYVTIAVSKETKELVNERKKEFGTKTYDETVARLAKPNAFAEMEKYAGMLKGAPEFKRDKRERTFD